MTILLPFCSFARRFDDIFQNHKHIVDILKTLWSLFLSLLSWLYIKAKDYKAYLSISEYFSFEHKTIIEFFVMVPKYRFTTRWIFDHPFSKYMPLPSAWLINVQTWIIVWNDNNQICELLWCTCNTTLKLMRTCVSKK